MIFSIIGDTFNVDLQPVRMISGASSKDSRFSMSSASTIDCHIDKTPRFEISTHQQSIILNSICPPQARRVPRR